MIGRTQLSTAEHDEEFHEQNAYANGFGAAFLRELELESASTRKCLEGFSMDLFKWKPHERSMEMGYLAVLVAEIPRWITAMINDSEIDAATFSHFKPNTTEELVKHFDENVEEAKKALQNLSSEELSKQFYLKFNGETVSEGNKLSMIEPTINHLVHHRGQLSVYMRLNDIAVPSIYGPSADDRRF